MTPTRNYMPEAMGVIVGLGVLAVWYFSSLAIDKSVVPSSYQGIFTTIGSAFGAFFGAYCAFKLRQLEENQNKLKKRKSALDACHFTLARQYNAVACIKREYERFKTPEARAFQMPAAKPPEYGDLKVKLDDLLFLADHDEISLLFEMSILQECFEQTVHAVNNRNNYAKESVQPGLAKWGLNGTLVRPPELQQALGDVTYKTALHASDTAFKYLCDTEALIADMQNRLFLIAKRIFPHERFLKIEGVPPLPKTDTTAK